MGSVNWTFHKRAEQRRITFSTLLLHPLTSHSPSLLLFSIAHLPPTPPPLHHPLPSLLPLSFLPLPCRLRLLLSQLERGDLPSVSNLKKTISYAADVLSSQNWESGATQKRYSTELKLAHSLPQHAHTYTNKHAHMHTGEPICLPLPTNYWMATVMTVMLCMKMCHREFSLNGTHCSQTWEVSTAIYTLNGTRLSESHLRPPIYYLWLWMWGVSNNAGDSDTKWMIPLYCTVGFFSYSSSGEDKLQSVKEEQVRAWLESTFTRQESVYEHHPVFKLPTFKTVVQAVMIGQHIDKYVSFPTIFWELHPFPLIHIPFQLLK